MEPVCKRAGWRIALVEFLEARRDATFAWGVNDCALTACDGIAAMTGVDLAGAHGLRGYTDEMGWQKKLLAFLRSREWPERMHPVEAAAQWIAEYAGFTDVAREAVEPGDVLVIAMLGRKGQDRALALMDGEGQVVCMGSDGLKRTQPVWHATGLTYSPIVRAWRIPEH